MDSSTIFDNSRNTRVSAFDRPSALRPVKPEYEFGKNAWISNSSIWRSGNTLLDGTTEDGPSRPTPARQTSNSNTSFSSARTSNGTGLSPSDHRNNAPYPPAPWNPSMGSATSTRQSQLVSPTKQRQNGFSLHDRSTSTAKNSTLLFDSAPDFDELAGNTARQSIRTANAQRFATNREMYDRSYLNLDDQARAQHPNLSRYTSHTASPPHHTAAMQPDRPITDMTNAGGLSFPNGRHTAGRSTAFFQGDSAAALGWSQSSIYDAHPIPISPTTKQNSKSASNGTYVNGNYKQSNALLDETATSMASFTLSDEAPGPHFFQEPTYQMSREQYNGPQSMNKQGSLSQSRYSAEAPYSDHVGTPLRFNSVSEQQSTPQYSGILPYVEHGAHSPIPGDYRSSLQSPYYSATGTPPTGPDSIRSAEGSGISSRTSHHDAVILDRKLRSLEPCQQNGVYYQTNPFQQMIYGANYEVPAHQSSMRMNPLAVPYSLTGYPNGGCYSATPRIPVRELDSPHVIRSAVLEDFRMNHKTNKRYELRDIYGHIVEFSGDQHGSRFIQQKLETANSDEKDQVFAEVQPNSLQLMTDVFGNYVIQKMFEHGNQTQKKVLANNMKGHVLNLSLQMYGCRVVQKALEHVLTDQQASMVKELDGPNKQVLRVIRDQNGNHVVQKAIERIPAEHIQFIVEAHRGEVVKLATHTYGCRVIQRILEHCERAAKRIILDELHGCMQPLITDSFGNYVVQHVIQNGERDDRRRVVSIVQQQLLIFSKHKFASNVVEKCIEFADDDQRAEVLQRLIGPNEQGQTPVLGLLRDQYGNYVIQKIFSLLKGAELEALIAEMRVCFPQLKRTSYGKQVMAIEKLLYESTAPQSVPSSSSRSSELASTNASSTVEGAITPPGLQMTKQYVPQGQHLYPIGGPPRS